MFGVTVATLAVWAHNGALPSVPTLGGHRRYRREDVHALLEKRKPAADPARTAMEEKVVRERK